MPIPYYKDLAETEWQAIILIERLKGQSKKKIAELLDCNVRKGLDPHWNIFREDGKLEYLYSCRSSRTPVKIRVYRHLDATCQDQVIPVTAGVMADTFGAPESKILIYIDQWYEDVEKGEHFPPCAECKFRGYKENPILENRVCLKCNAEIHDWPLDLWRADGRYTALLFDWGLIPEENVTDHIKGDGRDDSRNCSETH